jgi:hypothetical protein
MAANKINNKIEIKDTFCKVIKKDITMEILSPGLPIFYQCPVYYMNNDEIEYNKSSKPCFRCNNYCFTCITLEDIPRPKLTRQTNQHLLMGCKNQKEYTMVDYLKSNKETFYGKR